MFNNMEGEATCSVCLDLFDSPVLLPCGHNFCKRCISGLIELNENDYLSDDSDSGTNYSFKCPQCRRHVNLGSKGVDSLPANKPLHNIGQLLKEKDRKLSRSISWKDVCSKHKGEEENFFCQSCKTTVCPLCATTDHSGFGHIVKELEDYIAGEKEKMESLMEELRKIRGEVVAKKLYLQEIVDDAKACERESRDRAEREVQQLIKLIHQKNAEFTLHVTSQCRQLYGPIETMISVYKQLDNEASSLESEYNTLNYGDPMRRIKHYNKLSLQLSTFVTFRMRSVPTLPAPPGKLSQMMLSHLDEVFVAINKIAPLKTTREVTTQTDAKCDATDKDHKETGAKPKEKLKEPTVPVASGDTRSRSSNSFSSSSNVDNLQDSLKWFNPFKSEPTVIESNCDNSTESQWRNAAYLFASHFTATGSAAINKVQENGTTKNEQQNATSKHITLKRFTDKLDRGMSFHESLPCSPNFAFGGGGGSKESDNVFVFGAPAKGNSRPETFVFGAPEQKSKPTAPESGVDLPASSFEASGNTTTTTGASTTSISRQRSLAATNFNRPSLEDSDLKSSSAPNLLFSVQPSEPQHSQASNAVANTTENSNENNSAIEAATAATNMSNNIDKMENAGNFTMGADWHLPKPKVDHTKSPKSIKTVKSNRSRLIRRPQRTSTDPQPSTSGASSTNENSNGAIAMVNDGSTSEDANISAGFLNDIGLSDSNSEDELDPVFKKTRSFVFQKSNDYSDDSTNGSPGDRDATTLRGRKRSCEPENRGNSP